MSLFVITKENVLKLLRSRTEVGKSFLSFVNFLAKFHSLLCILGIFDSETLAKWEYTPTKQSLDADHFLVPKSQKLMLHLVRYTSYNKVNQYSYISSKSAIF